MKNIFILTVNLLIVSISIAQNANEQIELIIENDKLVLTDKYYTSGLFLTYKKDLQSDFILKKREDNVLQVNVTLGNEAYTPTNLISNNPSDFDRPYAGWLFLKTKIGSITDYKALFVTLETGITGEEALSGKLQNVIHDVLNIDEVVWIQEIEFKFLINLKAKYILTKHINKHHAFHYTIAPSLGTKDIFIENSIGYYFGDFNSLKNSSRLGVINKTGEKEFYGFVDFGYKYVAHNTLIQGGLKYNDALFTTNRTPNVFKFSTGAVLYANRNTFKFIFNLNTKETPKSTKHSYGTISFSHDF